MTTESPPRPYDVWQMSFEYEDQPGVAKVRPVVIGAVGVWTHCRAHLALSQGVPSPGA